MALYLKRFISQKQPQIPFHNGKMLTALGWLSKQMYIIKGGVTMTTIESKIANRLQPLMARAETGADWAEIAKLEVDLLADERAKFPNVSCSQCGRDFGPGYHGYSYCDQHQQTHLHIVIGKNGFVREQDARQTFDVVVKDIADGQYDDDAVQVIRIVPGSPMEDVTENVAWAIYDLCDGVRNYIVYNSAAYRMVEQHVGIAAARTCLDQNSEEAA